jgi:hypothetical protein
MVTETTTFVREVSLSPGTTLETLFSAPFTFVDARLAEHYGLASEPSAGGSAGGFAKVELPATRRGLLGHASVIAALSGPNKTSPVHRGLFFREHMLCESPPVPPPDAQSMGALLSSPDPNANARDDWENFQKVAPKCAGCHQSFHPLGLALESFDPIGRHRTTDKGKPIDLSVRLAGTGSGGGEYPDGFALARAIAKSPEGETCFAQHWVTYGLGAEKDPCLAAVVREKGREQVRDQAGAGEALTIVDLVVATTQVDAFYNRSRAK